MISANKIALAYCEFGFYGYFCDARFTYGYRKRAGQEIIESIRRFYYNPLRISLMYVDLAIYGLCRAAFFIHSSKCQIQMKPTIPSARVIFRASQKKAFSHVPSVASVERTLIKKGGTL